MSSSIKIDAFCPVGVGGTKGIDTTYLKLFIGGLPPSYTSKNLYDLFSSFGTIRESVVIPDRFRVRSRCYGFVTFSSENSAHSALKSLPILTKNGDELTVVLASTNTKPRRAHFNVKHGISGHKPLPTVNEEEETVHRMEIKTDKARKKAKTGKACNKDKNNTIGIYTDPSLFRTANIQQIAPAQFNINNTNKKNNSKYLQCNWPNDDIKKDFQDLKKVTVPNDNVYDQSKSWKLIAVEQEPEKESYHSSYECPSTYNDDDIRSVKSREWTPLSKSQQKQVDSTYNRRRIGTKSKRKNANKDKWAERKHWDNQVKTLSKKDEIEVDDTLTITSSVFNGFYQTEIDFVQKSEMDELRDAFKRRMQSKITGNDHEISDIEDKGMNTMWNAYEPVFCMTNLNEYNFQNVAPTPPILPIETAISVCNMNGKQMGLSDECMNNVNGLNYMGFVPNECMPYYGMNANHSFSNLEQSNMCYNTNYLYSLSNPMQSVGNSK